MARCHFCCPTNSVEALKWTIWLYIHQRMFTYPDRIRVTEVMYTVARSTHNSGISHPNMQMVRDEYARASRRIGRRRLVDVWVGLWKVEIIVGGLFNAVIVVVLEYFVSSLLTAENHEQDDKAEQSGEGDADGCQWSSPPRRVVQTAAVDHAVVDRHQRTTVQRHLHLHCVRRPTWMNHAAECFQLQRTENKNDTI